MPNTNTNVLADANVLYEAGKKSIKSSHFKQKTQDFELNLLRNVTKIKQEVLSDDFKPDKDNKFISKGRGKVRFISNNSLRDKTIIHVLCDEVVTPIMSNYLIYDNSSSQKGKGISFHRRRFERKLRDFYKEHKTNQGYILIVDFSGYYANMLHKNVLDIYQKILQAKIQNKEIVDSYMHVIRAYLKTFEVDVSRFTDEEIESLYKNKVDPSINVGISENLLTGEKFLLKGMEIGNQLSQNTGLLYASRVDNAAKIVARAKDYGRYTDDMYCISESKEYLKYVLDAIISASKEIGLFVNMQKTRILKISNFFRYLQIMYKLNSDGKLIRKINSRTITRERRKLKAFKHLLSKHKISYLDIENAFKSWICAYYHIMSRIQLKNIGTLYHFLFNRMPTWNKRKKIKFLLKAKTNHS